jgi:hypothetical protein
MAFLPLLAFYSRGFYAASTLDTKRALTREDVLNAVHLVQDAGTQIFVEFIQ